MILIPNNVYYLRLDGYGFFRVPDLQQIDLGVNDTGVIFCKGSGFECYTWSYQGHRSVNIVANENGFNLVTENVGDPPDHIFPLTDLSWGRIAIGEIKISPDGKNVAFAYLRDGTHDPAGNGSLHIFSAEGRAYHDRVSFVVDGIETSSAALGWMPDSRSLIYTPGVHTNNPSTTFQYIAFYHLATGQKEILPFKIKDDNDTGINTLIIPVEGQTVAMYDHFGVGTAMLYLLSPDHKHLYEVNDNPIDTSHIAWSQDGSMLAYVIPNANQNWSPSKVVIINPQGKKVMSFHYAFPKEEEIRRFDWASCN